MTTGDHSTTQHEIEIQGRAYRYEARAGTLPIHIDRYHPPEEDDHRCRPPATTSPEKKGAGESAVEGPTIHVADMFFVAYSLLDVPAPQRTISFVFNGGPGSAAIWLHMGALGPWRVETPDDGTSYPLPPRLVPNQESWLPFTDLVFIDPVTTGFSRPHGDVDARQFHGVVRDVQTVAEFIRLYTARYGRWASPKVLVGESYGTTRAAALAMELQQRQGMALSGLVLISAALQFQTLEFDSGNDLAFLVHFPTYATTAWYHGRLETQLQQCSLEEVARGARDFAYGPLASGLLKGWSLPAAERDELIEGVARWTGLRRTFAELARGRVAIHHFCKELLRDEGRTVGRLDTRVKGDDADLVEARPEYDPSLSAMTGAYTAALNHYLRSSLGYACELPYEVLTEKVHPWNFKPAINRYLDVADDLRQAIAQNPHLRVLVANGYYDLATPFAATEYTIHHLRLPESLRENITMEYYEAGHMMYTHSPSRIKLCGDARALYTALRADDTSHQQLQV